jgi:hypothetical protein
MSEGKKYREKGQENKRKKKEKTDEKYREIRNTGTQKKEELHKHR